jgi:hypothetical protein
VELCCAAYHWPLLCCAALHRPLCGAVLRATGLCLVQVPASLLQQFAWTEADIPRKLVQRNAQISQVRPL